MTFNNILISTYRNVQSNAGYSTYYDTNVYDNATIDLL